MKTFKLNPEIIIEIVNTVVGKDVTKNLKTRKREYVEPRMLAMYFLYSYTSLSLAKVGAIFNKDHATALHAFRAIRGYASTDKELMEKFVSIQQSIVKNIPVIKEYSPQARFETIAEDLTQTKRLNAKLIHRAINLKEMIDNIPEHLKQQYFGKDEFIYTTKQKDNGVGVVQQP